MRNSATGICAKITRIGKAYKQPHSKRITVQLDDQRTTSENFAFSITDAIYFPFKEGEEVVLTLRRSER